MDKCFMKKLSSDICDSTIDFIPSSIVFIGTARIESCTHSIFLHPGRISYLFRILGLPY